MRSTASGHPDARTIQDAIAEAVAAGDAKRVGQLRMQVCLRSGPNGFLCDHLRRPERETLLCAADSPSLDLIRGLLGLTFCCPAGMFDAPGDATETARRLALCRACATFNGNICEREFPAGVCLCTWRQFLARGRCPDGRF